MSGDKERLLDMVEQIELILTHVGSDRAALADEVRRAATLRWLEVLGEAAANVSTALRERHVEVPWRDIVGMRNVLIHAYPDVRLDRVWAAVERLPELRSQIDAIVEELPK